MGLAIGLALTGAAQVTLPYTATFQLPSGSNPGFTVGTLNGQNGWLVLNGTGNVISDPQGIAGNQSVELVPSSSALPLIGIPFAAPPPNTSIAYADCFVKPVASTRLTSYIYLGNSLILFAPISGYPYGLVYTFDGTTFHPPSTIAGLFSINADGTSPNWMRLTFRLDFTAKTWDLYGNGAFIAHDVPFPANSPGYLSFLEFQGDASVSNYLGYFDAGFTDPVFFNGDGTSNDVNNDGIPDDWENKYGLYSTATNVRNEQLSGNGTTVLENYISGTDPYDYYMGVLPMLTSLVDPSGEPGAQGIVSIKVTRASDGTLLVNAPVTLSVTGASTQIAAAPGGTTSTSVAVRTDSNGVASAYVVFTTLAPDTLTATAQAVAQSGSTITTSISVTLNPPTGSGAANLRVFTSLEK